MSISCATGGPDLSPWSSDLSNRVQPVISALFHDMMGPLTLIKNRLYLIRRHLQAIHDDPGLPEDVRVRVGAVIHLLDGVDDAAHRIHRGMAVPRDAIWAAVLEGEAFHPDSIIEEIAAAMRAGEAGAPVL